MRYPDFLPENGTIGFVAPSFGAATEPYITRFESALQKFHAMGYKSIEAGHARASEGIGISGPPDVLGAELNGMYLNSGADALISIGGGELMCEVVPYIDFDAIAASKPKWYMGYSDNTNFTFLSATLADTAAIYGYCAPSFGMGEWHESLSDALRLLCGRQKSVRGYPAWERDDGGEEDPLAGFNLTEKTEYRYFNADGAAKMSGRLLGGCLDILNCIRGTRFDRVREFNARYREDGVIWFLECCDLSVLDMRRTLWATREAGWFDSAKGFLIGRPFHYDEPLMGLDQYDAVTGVLGPLGVPIVMDVDIGHLPPMLPIVCGAMADVDAGGNNIEIRYDFR